MTLKSKESAVKKRRGWFNGTKPLRARYPKPTRSIAIRSKRPAKLF